VDGKQAIDAWGPHDSAITETSLTLSPGTPHTLRVDYQELEYNARLQLKWRPAGSGPAKRTLWVPPGDWIDAWTGFVVSGPRSITGTVPLDQIPIFIRAGTILPLAPQMQYTGQSQWDPIKLDVYPRAGQADQATLYEDDTVSIGYQHGEYRKTPLMVVADSDHWRVNVTIGPATGSFKGASSYRGYVLRLHRPVRWPARLVPVEAEANGSTVQSAVREFVRDRSTMPFGDKTGAPDGDVWEIRLPATPVTEAIDAEITFGTRP
jgi:alpha-glucosidase